MSFDSYWQKITTKILKLKELLIRGLKAIGFFVKSKKEGIVSFCKKYYLYLTYLLSLFWTIIFGCLLFFGILTINPGTINDLLSTIWEGLVATLAIVFSIVLVAGQLASGYSRRMLGQVFKRTTLAYMFLFIFSALLPVVVLASGEIFLGLTRWTWAGISLILAVGCLSFLIPYFLSLKEWLKPEKLLTDLKGGGEKSLEQTWGKELPIEVYGIRDLVTGSYQFKHYDIFDAGVEALRDLAIFATRFFPSKKAKKGEEAESGKEEKGPEAVEKIVDMLGDIGCLVAADRLAGVKVAEALGGIGGKWAAENLSRAKKVLEKLSEIGETSLEKKCDKTALQVVYAIHSVGKIAMDSDLPAVQKQAITRLRLIFLKTAKDMPNVAKTAAYQLRTLGEKAVEKEFPSETRHVLRALGAVALKSVEFNWPVRECTNAILALKDVISKAAERPKLLPATKRGLSFLRGVGEACMPEHLGATVYVVKQLWILGAESPSEELTSHILDELTNLENKTGREPIDTGFKKAWGWARAQDKWPELKKKLSSLKTQYLGRRLTDEEWEELNSLLKEN